MFVKEIMTKDVVYAEVPGSTDEALEAMIKENLSGLPVVKRGTKELAGIVTKTDFTRDPEESQLALLMVKDAVTTTPDSEIGEVAKTFMLSGLRRMPVVKGNSLVGLITVNDIVWRAIAKMKISEPVSKYMVKNFTTIWGEVPLTVASEIMRISGARALPVLDSNSKLVGIIGDTDFLRVAQIKESTEKSEMSGGTEGDQWGWDSKNVVYITKKSLEIPNIKVEEIMTKSLVTATRNTKLSDCARKMKKHNVDQLPVIDAEGNMIGLVRNSALLRVFQNL